MASTLMKIKNNNNQTRLISCRTCACSTIFAPMQSHCGSLGPRSLILLNKNVTLIYIIYVRSLMLLNKSLVFLLLLLLLLPCEFRHYIVEAQL